MQGNRGSGEPPADRRPIASRGARPVQAIVRLLLRTSITPNQISAAGILFAIAGGLAFAGGGGRPWLFVAGALCVQLRLMCNLLDGLVAVEGGRGGPTGILFNELPDRLEDSLFLVGFGYGVGWPAAGFAAALLAVGTAYLRAFGASLGQGQDFRGPMAKPQRMAALTAAALLACAERVFTGSAYAGRAILLLIAVGTAITCWRRIARMAAEAGRAA